MADVAVQHTMATPGGTIVFNDGSADQYYINAMPGFSMPEIRAPVDNVPLGDGGLVHDFWLGPLRWGVEGIFLIQSTRVMEDIQQIRNEMEEDLLIALESIIRANGTWAYTPRGLASRTWTVNNEIKLDCPHADNYLTYTFNFGMIAADPNWAGSS